MSDEEKKELNESSEEEPKQSEEVKTDKLKHERLAEEHRRNAETKERFRDFAEGRLRHDSRGVMRKRKDKFLGGTRGRRGG